MYSFSFQGQEKDDEVNGSTGTSYTAEFWQYDPRAAKRWNIDPEFRDFPQFSPYLVFNGNPVFNKDPKGNKADGYVDENGTYLGDDGSTTSHETRVMDKAQWNQLTQNGTSITGKEKTLQSTGILLREYEKGIRLSNATWTQLESRGGTRFEPALTNNSNERVMWKPDDSNNPRTSYNDALEAPAHKDIYHPIDGLKTWRMEGKETYHVPDGERAIVHPGGLVEAASFNYQAWSLLGYGYGTRSTADWKKLSDSKP